MTEKNKAKVLDAADLTEGKVDTENTKKIGNARNERRIQDYLNKIDSEDQLYALGYRCIGHLEDFFITDKNRNWIWRRDDDFLIWYDQGNGNGFFKNFIPRKIVTKEMLQAKGWDSNKKRYIDLNS